MRQLEYGAEIGRAVVNFRGPIVFCVIARYHGGAYVVFSQTLNEHLASFALEGSFASVIGGAPAAAVVFPNVVRRRVESDTRVVAALDAMKALVGTPLGDAQKAYAALLQEVEAEQQAELAREFDTVHSVDRAKRVGSIRDVISVGGLRSLIATQIREKTPRADEVATHPEPHSRGRAASAKRRT